MRPRSFPTSLLLHHGWETRGSFDGVQLAMETNLNLDADTALGYTGTFQAAKVTQAHRYYHIQPHTMSPEAWFKALFRSTKLRQTKQPNFQESFSNYGRVKTWSIAPPSIQKFHYTETLTSELLINCHPCVKNTFFAQEK